MRPHACLLHPCLFRAIDIAAVDETAVQYHARLEALLQDAFRNQAESTAWWVGFSHPKHGDQYWVFGNSSDTDGTYPPDVPATIEDHFYIGSISKTFGATVNLQLIEQGNFAVDQTIESITPDFAVEFPQYANKTPGELMGMQTKVPDFLNNPNGMMTQLRADPSNRYSIFEIIESAMELYPATLDDETLKLIETSNMTVDEFLKLANITEYHEYSTTNILAMEYLAETVTGLTMQNMVQDLVLTPLGLDNTAQPPRDAVAGTVVPEPAVRSYIGESCVREFSSIGAEVEVGYRNDAFADSIVQTGTGGSMYSTINDLLKWAESGVGDSLLSPETVSLRHVFRPTSLYMQYGIGMHLIFGDQELYSGWYGHDGDAFSSNARAIKNDEMGAAFASAINTCGTEKLHDDGLKILVGDLKNDNSASSSPIATPGQPTRIPTGRPTTKQITKSKTSKPTNTVTRLPMPRPSQGKSDKSSSKSEKQGSKSAKSTSAKSGKPSKAGNDVNGDVMGSRKRLRIHQNWDFDV